MTTYDPNSSDAVLGGNPDSFAPADAAVLGGETVETHFYTQLEQALADGDMTKCFHTIAHCLKRIERYPLSEKRRIEGELFDRLKIFSESEDQATFALDCVKQSRPFYYGEQRFYHQTFSCTAQDWDELQHVIRSTSVLVMTDDNGKTGYSVFPKQYGFRSLVNLHHNVESLEQFSQYQLTPNQQMLLENAAKNYRQFIDDVLALRK